MKAEGRDRSWEEQGARQREETRQAKGTILLASSHEEMEKPPVGFEPTTSRLLSGCSTS